MKQKLLLLFTLNILLFKSDSIFSQQMTLDSLLKVNANYTKEDTNKVQLLNTITMYYVNINPNMGIQYAEKAISLAKKLPVQKYLAKAYQSKGSVFTHISSYTNALECYQKALTIYENTGDKKEIAQSLFLIGYTLSFNLPNDSNALAYFQNALVIQQSIGDKYGMARSFDRIGYSYGLLSNETKALEYAQKALSIRESIGDKQNIANTVNIIGTIYAHLRNFPKALEYYHKALAIAESMDDKAGITIELGNISDVYQKLSDYTKALDYLEKALMINKLTGSKDDMADNYIDISRIYLKLKNYRKAISFAQQTKAIADSIGTLDNQQYALEVFTKAYAATKQFKKAYNYYRQYIVIKDSIDNAKKQKKIAQLQMQYEYGKKTDSLKLAGKITGEKLKQQQTLSKLQLQQQLFYSTGILVLLALASFYFIYRNRLQRERLKIELTKEKVEQEKKEAEFQRSLADISLTALRSQMNPHFIFNCLNSIKLYTTQNDTTAASEYLTKFSRLIRLVLDNSRNDRITLASELDALRLYMEMEAMRFKEKLKYNISVEKEVDMDYIEIPPLLLQPYVENAIWHGLMQKEEGGQIDITIGMQPDESMLVINITDNGIGRVKSAELMSKTATKHKSYGMKVTSERLALINQVYNTGANVIIHDLTDKNGRASGTQVTIKIPIE